MGNINLATGELLEEDREARITSIRNAAMGLNLATGAVLDNESAFNLATGQARDNTEVADLDELIKTERDLYDEITSKARHRHKVRQLRAEAVGGKEPTGLVSGIFDILSRGQYASAGFVNSLLTSEFSVRAIGTALNVGFNEFISPDERLSYRDLLKVHASDWYAENPASGAVIGTVLDIALDPTTYLAGSGLLKMIPRAGKAVAILPRSLKVSKAGRSFMDHLIKRSITTQEAGATKTVFQSGLTELKGLVTSDQLKKAKSLGTVDTHFKRLQAGEDIGPVKLLVRKGKDNLDELVVDHQSVTRLLAYEKAGQNTIPISSKLRKGGKTIDMDVDILKGVSDEAGHVVASGDVMPIGFKVSYDAARKEAEEIMTGLFVRENFDALKRVSAAGGIQLDTLVDLANKGEAAIQQIDNAEALGKINIGVDFAKGEYSGLFGGGVTWLGKKVPKLDKQSYDAFLNATGLRTMVEAVKTLPAAQWVNEFTRHFSRNKLMMWADNKGKFVEQLANWKGIDPKTGDKIQMAAGSAGKITGYFHSMESVANVSSKTIAKKAGVTETDAHIAKQFVENMVGRKHEYMRFRDKMQRKALLLEARVARTVYEDAIGLSKEQRDLVGRTAKEVREKIKSELDSRKLDALPQKEVSKIKGDILKRNGLDKDRDALAYYTKFNRHMKEAAKLETEAGILNHLIAGYAPRRYAGISNVKQLVKNRRLWFTRKSPLFTPDQKAKFATDAEAIANGWTPINDALMLSVLRLNESQSALHRKQFVKGMESIFGVDDINKVPASLVRDFEAAGAVKYHPGSSPLQNRVLAGLDRFTQIFKKQATVLRPAFGMRQIFSNATQSYAVLGARAMKAFDPRVLDDTFNLLSGQAPKMDIVTELGETITGPQFLKEVYEQGVIRNIAIDAQGQLVGWKGAKRLSDKVDGVNRLMKQGLSQDAAEGWHKAIAGASRYIDWPAHIEDFSRTSLYMNARRMGYGKEEAANLVDEALFDYLHGLSEDEIKVVRALIPFYSFQRFAVPLVGKMLAQTPQRAKNLHQVTEGFFEVWGRLHQGVGTLSEAERQTLPGYLIKQPSAFSEYDRETGETLFSTFNNFSILGVLENAEIYDDGDIDMEKSIAKGILSQTAPWLKVPVELFANKIAFTDAQLPDSVSQLQKSRKGAIDPDKLTAALTAHIGALIGDNLRAGSTGGALLGGAVGYIGSQLPGDPIERAVHNLLGMERTVNADGEVQVYVDAHRFYALSSVFPLLRESTTMSDDSIKWNERVARAIFGVGTISMDLLEEQERKRKGWEYERRSLVSQLKKAAEAGLTGEITRIQEDIAELLGEAQLEHNIMQEGEIRGALGRLDQYSLTKPEDLKAFDRTTERAYQMEERRKANEREKERR